MALHKTQCPHCFTTYVISDEQYRVSEGMVRCGTCRERFQARLITSQEIPRFDPREAFIEPLSEEPQETRAETTDFDSSDIEFADPHTESTDYPEPTTAPFDELDNAPLEETKEPETNDSMAIEPESTINVDVEPTAGSVSNLDILEAERALADIIAEDSETSSAATPLEETTESSNPATDEAVEALAPLTGAKPQQELALPDSDSSSTESDAADVSQILDVDTDQAPTTHDVDLDQPSEISINDDSALIDEVDHLIEDKLLSKQDESASVQSTRQAAPVNRARKAQRPNPRLDPRLAQRLKPRPVAAPVQHSKTSLGRGAMLVALMGISLLLLTTFVYQLWLKQMVVFPAGSYGERLMQAITTPLTHELAQRDIALPVRRNLSKLELLSARTEAHPTRSSTTLLRVSLINHAEISQPLPWLELTLTDSEGKLVSRRQLSPLDYLYNNNTTAQIGARELKKITIELLAFPKQASGYELRLLNK